MDDLALIILAYKALLHEGKTLNLKRSSNIKALISQIISTIANPECTHYTNSSRMWVKYIITNQFFGGSYYNYYYNNIGTQYSLSKFLDYIQGFNTWN